MSAALRRVTGELCAARQRRLSWYSLHLRNLYPACKECFGTATQAPEPEAPNGLPTRSLGVQFAVSFHIPTAAGNKWCSTVVTVLLKRGCLAYNFPYFGCRKQQKHPTQGD